MHKNLAHAKKLVAANKTRLLVSGLVVTTTIAVLQHEGIKSLNAFITEKGLFDEYYQIED